MCSLKSYTRPFVEQSKTSWRKYRKDLHSEFLLLQQMNPVAKAGYFGVLFDKAPTYEEIKFGTPKTAAAIELNRLFSLKINNDVHLAGVEGLHRKIPPIQNCFLLANT